eukprot:14565966-Ditylum_brightwellii.AAC.1
MFQQLIQALVNNTRITDVDYTPEQDGVTAKAMVSDDKGEQPGPKMTKGPGLDQSSNQLHQESQTDSFCGYWNTTHLTTTKEGITIPGYLENATKPSAKEETQKAEGAEDDATLYGTIKSVAKPAVSWLQSVLLDRT